VGVVSALFRKWPPTSFVVGSVGLAVGLEVCDELWNGKTSNINKRNLNNPVFMWPYWWASEDGSVRAVNT
jgi:hypothetical protein